MASFTWCYIDSDPVLERAPVKRVAEAAKAAKDANLLPPRFIEVTLDHTKFTPAIASDCRDLNYFARQVLAFRLAELEDQLYAAGKPQLADERIEGDPVKLKAAMDACLERAVLPRDKPQVLRQIEAHEEEQAAIYAEVLEEVHRPRNSWLGTRGATVRSRREVGAARRSLTRTRSAPALSQAELAWAIARAGVPKGATGWHW